MPGDKYTGEWKEGQKHGKGKMIFFEEATYEGEWADNVMHGYGVFADNYG